MFHQTGLFCDVKISELAKKIKKLFMNNNDTFLHSDGM